MAIHKEARIVCDICMSRHNVNFKDEVELNQILKDRGYEIKNNLLLCTDCVEDGDRFEKSGIVYSVEFIPN
jgi:hypothetical protein